MQEISAFIITIGDEILYGQIVDTNAQWMSAFLDEAGINTIKRLTIGDNKEDILSAFAEAEKSADIVLITGGLGPTPDDLTKPCITEYFNDKLEMRKEALEDLSDLFKKIDRELTPINKKQAELPTKALYLKNDMGTAPGMWMERNNTVFVSMPGVPYEMKFLMKERVLPQILTKFKPSAIVHKRINTIGIGESWLSELIGEKEKQLPKHIALAYLPSPGIVKLRFTAKGSNKEQLTVDLEKTIEEFKPLINDYIFGYDDETLEEAIGRMLKAKGKTIVTAESCTGGNVARTITKVPGSSEYFLGSVVSYSNDVKKKVLGVKEETLDSVGAVSEETVKQMAIGAKKLLNADIAISTSGIAGPGGGTPEKPVGTVWIGYADENQVVAKKINLGKNRLLNIEYSTIAALNLLKRHLV
ncbi:competence/damage-inducible protein A [Marinigracilibium pacificum]|uniref:CinA-like protein n=1 Tax=Marinigracilibium pacificum TaxID=2729599 RepID=A0A848J749_9BACT|nr:competence/damage-inducible protein A [Marinigracilibium pacificum]NMM50219.1 competence/damage-inducible protein A [Marinigracilibium pacificum]